MDLALEITNLNKSYSTFKAVKNLNLSVRKGEIFALLGPNGAGKSTTINMIGGSVLPTSGSIKIMGHDNQTHFVKTRSLTGIMPQELQLDNFFPIGRALKLHSGYYGYDDDPKWRNFLLETLQLKEHENKKPVKLSGGMKRRFMVAKALIHKPELVILDEPTAGVDVELRKQMWDFVREINSFGVTILLTTHYLEEAQAMCQRVAILNKGELVTVDKTENLLSKVKTSKLIARNVSQNNLDTLVKDSVHIQHKDNALVFTLNEQFNSQQALSFLNNNNISFSELHTQKAQLEDVFLELTKA